MNPSAYLVNPSRGPVVDEGALIEALQNQLTAGAAIDVYDVEPLPADHQRDFDLHAELTIELDLDLLRRGMDGAQTRCEARCVDERRLGSGIGPRPSCRASALVREGLGAALIMPTVTSLIAGNFTGRQRARAYGVIAASAAGADAVAAAPHAGRRSHARLLSRPSRRVRSGTRSSSA